MLACIDQLPDHFQVPFLSCKVQSIHVITRCHACVHIVGK